MSSTASTGWAIMPLSFDNGWSTPDSMLVATQGNSARTTRPSQAGHGTTSTKPGTQIANQNEPDADVPRCGIFDPVKVYGRTTWLRGSGEAGQSEPIGY